MKRQKLFIKIKKIVPIIFFVISVLFFVLLFLSKNKLNDFASKAIQLKADSTIVRKESAYIDSAYNYSKKESSYEITFIEFGSTGCSACKRMEKVMEDLREIYPDKVNIIFYNVTFPENHDLMKYYGIAAIPTQLLLDKNGKVFFRHTGYYSTENLTRQFNTKLK